MSPDGLVVAFAGFLIGLCVYLLDHRVDRTR
jgi:hypothetical protein